MDPKEVSNGDYVRITIDDGGVVKEGTVIVRTNLGITVKFDTMPQLLFIAWEDFDKTTELTILEKAVKQKET